MASTNLRVSMTTTATTALLILVLALYLSVHHVTVAENPLIGITCDSTEAPETCIQCMKSDSRNSRADPVLLAIIVVECASTHAELLRGNMSWFAASETNDNIEYKEALQDCVTWFSYAKNDLFVATHDLENGDYEGADRAVYTAVMRLVACERRRRKSTVGRIEALPMMVEYELGMYNDLTEAAMKIINGLY